MHKKLMVARLQALQHFPYLTRPILAMRPIEQKGLGTIATDKRWRLRYDPDFVDAASIPNLVAVFVHEVSHLLRDHPGRFQQSGCAPEEQPLWNLAGDLEINPSLVEAGLDLFPGTVMPATFKLPDHLLMEQYYEKLRLMFPPQGGKGKKPPQGDKPGQGKCGSCAGSGDGNEESDSGGDGESEGDDGIDEAEGDAIRTIAAQDIKDASEGKSLKFGSTTRGSIPGAFTRWAKKHLTENVSWDRKLSVALRAAFAVDMGIMQHTYSRPNRRWPGDVVFPVMRQPKPEIAIVVDTSGSMSEELLNAALGQTDLIVKAVGGSMVTVIPCDAAVYPSHVKRTRNPAQQWEYVGGGGTDMGVGIRYAVHKVKPKPSVIVVLTDGYTPWPEAKPHIPVIIGLIGTAVDKQSCPQWALSVVKIKVVERGMVEA